MMNSADLTVVVPVYNGMPFIRETIESLLGQTWSGFRLLVVNDGSTDGSRDFLDSLTDPRITVIHQSNKGLCRTLNDSIFGVATEFVARLDQDDLAVPERLAVQRSFLERNPEYGAVLGNIVRIAGDGRSFGSHLNLQGDAVDYSSSQFGCIVHSTLMMRTEVFKELGGYRPMMYPVDDYDLLLRLEERIRIAVISAPMVRYRIHGAAGSFATAEAMDWKTRMALENAKRRRSGEEEIGIEEFRVIESRRPALAAFFSRCAMRGRLLFRAAGLDIGEKKLIQAMPKLFGAFLLSPKYTTGRLYSMVISKRKGMSVDAEGY